MSNELELFIIIPSERVSNMNDPDVLLPLIEVVAEVKDPEVTLDTNKVSPPLLK